MKNKIVIVGAGYGGVLTAKKLAKRFKHNDDVSITIIDKSAYHVMLTELHEVAAFRVDEDAIRANLKKIFAGRKVTVVLDTIEDIDFENKTALGIHDNYEYDYLIISTGSKPTFFGVKGADKNSHTLWSYDDALKIRHRLETMFREASSLPLKEERRKLLNFFVVGAGFTGVEMAGELAEYVPYACDKFNIDREDVSISIIDILERTIPNLPSKLSEKVEKRLVKMGVNVILKTSVVSIGPDYIETVCNEKHCQTPAGMIIWAAGIESSDLAGEAAKYLETAGRNRLKTDHYLRSLTDEGVYVIGDNMLYTPKGSETPVPQVVENCEHSAATCAKNIDVTITGKGEMEEYTPEFHGFMVCVGGRYGVARVGFPNFMVNLPSFLAMLSKHMINIVYFIQILGWNKVWTYMKHEFFNIRNKRSFVGGHFSNRTASFLLFPLRVWLGVIWLFEGIHKAMEGWFSSPNLAGFFGGANAWYNSILGIGASDGETAATGAEEAAAEALDALTAATGEVAEGVQAIGTVLMDFNILGLFHTILVSGKDLASSVLADFAFKLDVPLMNWFVDTFILANDSVQIVMQSIIVVTEIIIGLALIGGLFTTPSAIVSLVLQFMFVCTTGLYLSTFWMVFAGVAVLVGGGTTFGLDYWVMPALKKRWKKIGFVRKLYIYND
ncbi:MAG: FAD-dependent oxidoreductase [Anaerovoracaceae bacterium]